jgi:uncharacterized protein YqgC (DUF456 family)
MFAPVTPAEIAGLVLALLVMLVGVIGCVVPGLPGTPLVLGAALVHKLVFGPNGAAWWLLVVLALFTGLALVADYVASVYGAKRLGATWRGALGAILGGVAGLFFLPIGILVGPFLGAFLLELAGRRHWKDASKAGAGATLGLLVGAAAKVAASIAMILVFAVNVLYRALSS